MTLQISFTFSSDPESESDDDSDELLSFFLDFFFFFLFFILTTSSRSESESELVSCGRKIQEGLSVCLLGFKSYVLVRRLFILWLWLLQQKVAYNQMDHAVTVQYFVVSHSAIVNYATRSATISVTWSPEDQRCRLLHQEIGKNAFSQFLQPSWNVSNEYVFQSEKCSYTIRQKWLKLIITS